MILFITRYVPTCLLLCRCSLWPPHAMAILLYREEYAMRSVLTKLISVELMIRSVNKWQNLNEPSAIRSITVVYYYTPSHCAPDLLHSYLLLLVVVVVVEFTSNQVLAALDKKMNRLDSRYMKMELLTDLFDSNLWPIHNYQRQRAGSQCVCRTQVPLHTDYKSTVSVWWLKWSPTVIVFYLLLYTMSSAKQP